MTAQLSWYVQNFYLNYLQHFSVKEWYEKQKLIYVSKMYPEHKGLINLILQDGITEGAEDDEDESEDEDDEDIFEDESQESASKNDKTQAATTALTASPRSPGSAFESALEEEVRIFTNQQYLWWLNKKISFFCFQRWKAISLILMYSPAHFAIDCYSHYFS